MSGRKSECKKCCSHRHRVRKLQVINILGSKCACCSNSNPDHLEVDHINNDGAERRRSKLDESIYLRILNQKVNVSTVQLLCSNCNMSKAILQKCVHQSKPGFGSL